MVYYYYYYFTPPTKVQRSQLKKRPFFSKAEFADICCCETSAFTAFDLSLGYLILKAHVSRCIYSVKTGLPKDIGREWSFWFSCGWDLWPCCSWFPAKLCNRYHIFLGMGDFLENVLLTSCLQIREKCRLDEQHPYLEKTSGKDCKAKFVQMFGESVTKSSVTACNKHGFPFHLQRWVQYSFPQNTQLTLYTN